MNKKQVLLLTQNTIIGALYVVLTLINPISYGVFQFRLSTLLMGVPFYKPQLSLGILIGVMISNLPSPLGPIDILSGFLIQSVSLFIFNRIFKNAYVKSIAYGVWCGFVVAAALYISLQVPFWPSVFSVAVSNILFAIIGSFAVEKFLRPFLDKAVPELDTKVEAEKA